MISDAIETEDIQSISGKTVLMEVAGKASADGCPDESVIDRKAALERTMGDEQFLSDLLQEFIEDVPGIMDRIGNAIGRQNISTVAKESKRLAGGAGNLGATDFTDAALNLEKVSRKGFVGKTHDAFRQLAMEADKLIAYVRAFEFGNVRKRTVS